MIEISDSLALAATARTRNPTYRVTVAENKVSEPTELVSGSSLPNAPHRVAAGDDYYIITAYEYQLTAQPLDIYYKRTTTLENSSDWTSGYSTLVSNSSEMGAKHHDLFITGDRVIIAYQKSSGIIYARESTNGGSSFGSEYEVVDLSWTHNLAPYVSIADELTMFVLSYNSGYQPTLVHKVSRPDTSSSWASDGYWDLGEYYISNISAAQSPVAISARQIGDLYRVVGTFYRGTGASFLRWPSAIDYSNGSWGILQPLFGGVARSDFYWWGISNLTSELNGYYFAILNETVLSSADSSGPATTYNSFLAKTKDLKNYSIIPFTERLATGEYSGYGLRPCGVVVTESGDYVCVPINWQGGEGFVYLFESSNWFGESMTTSDISSRIVDDISISSAENKAATATLSVSCARGGLDDNPIISHNAAVFIDAGYGDELQRRFTGVVRNYSKTIGANKKLGVNVMDNLAYSTSRGQQFPHVLLGQNVFHVDFTEETDLDMFITQEGVFTINEDHLYTENRGEENIIFAGVDTQDAMVCLCKFKVSGNDVTHAYPGIVFHGYTQENGNSTYKSIIWRGLDGKFVYSERRIWIGSYQSKGHQISSTSQAISLDSYHYLMVKMKHGAVDVLYSTNGVNFFEGMTDVEIGWSDVYDEYVPQHHDFYVGLSASLDKYFTETIWFDEFDVFSMYPPISGSDAMKYLAGLGNIETNEQMDIDDDFDSDLSLWETPGYLGNWAVSGGNATGYGGDLLRASTSAEDIIVNATVTLKSNTVGIFARSDSSISECYGLLADTSYVYLKERSGDSWTTLMRVPHSHSETTANLQLVCRGPYISGFMDGVLYVFAYDTTLKYGYYGMIADGLIGNKSLVDRFWVDGFYIPLDGIVVKPGDTVASVMGQIQDQYDGGMFYCDVNGSLRWGTFYDATGDLDARSTMLIMDTTKNPDRIITFARVVGDNAYGEASSRAWGAALGGHTYLSVEDKSMKTKEACVLLAATIVAESLKVSGAGITIPGNPALELGDVITVSEEPDESGNEYIVRSMTERIGLVYEADISDLRSQSAETI